MIYGYKMIAVKHLNVRGAQYDSLIMIVPVIPTVMARGLASVTVDIWSPPHIVMERYVDVKVSRCVIICVAFLFFFYSFFCLFIL